MHKQTQKNGYEHYTNDSYECNRVPGNLYQVVTSTLALRVVPSTWYSFSKYALRLASKESGEKMYIQVFAYSYINL